MKPILTIEYNPVDAIPVADGRCEVEVSRIIDIFRDVNGAYKWAVSSSLMIDYFRLAVVQGKISHEELRFKFKDEIITVHENGSLSHWPKGFCDYLDIVIRKIITGN